MSVALSEHLPLLASAPDGIQKLRGLILELAVRGKLVPQDPKDEPASELLKRIAKERARLESDGKIKKSKPLPPVDENEQPFALPVSWTWTRLGEITNFGQTDKDGEIRESTWVLDLEDIQKDTSVLLRKVRFAERQAKSDKNRFQEGDVLYGKLRPYLNKVIVADEEGVCTTEILPVRGFYGIFPRFLMHAVKRPDFLAYVNSKSYGMKMPRLGTDDGRSALFPLPPLAEQHRIVAKIDELMALCDRLEAEVGAGETAHAKLVETLLGTLTQSTDADDHATNWQRLAEHFETLFTTEYSLDVLKQTILQLAVMGKLVPQDPNDESASELLKRIAKERAKLESEGTCRKSKSTPPVGEDEQPFELPDGWGWVRLGTLAIFENGDRSSRYPNEGDHQPSGVPFFGAKDMIDGLLRFDSGLRFISEEKFSELSNGKLVDRDFVVLLRGTVGKIALFRANPEFSTGFINAQMLIVRILNKHLCDYFGVYSATNFFQSLITRKTTGSAIKQMPANVLADFLFPLPPLAEQHRIVAKVDELMALCDRLKADLAESRTRQSRLSATLIESALQAA